MRAKPCLWAVLFAVHAPLHAHADALGGLPAAGDAAQVPAPFHNVVLGAVVDGGLGTSMAGDALMFEIGGQFAGLKSLRDRRWLLQWDALLAARGGYLANQHPYLFLIGGHQLAWAEGGYRFHAAQRWSPYLGARLGDEIQVLAHPGLGLSKVDTINSVDRVGGTIAAGIIRADFGVSFLEGWRSLLLVVFVQEDLHASEANTPAQAFGGGGIGARFDLARRLAASIEGVWAVAPARRISSLGLTDQTMHLGVSATFRGIFRNGMWIGGAVLLERDSDHLVYDGSTATTYDTANAPRFGVTVVYGVPLGRTR